MQGVQRELKMKDLRDLKDFETDTLICFPDTLCSFLDTLCCFMKTPFRFLDLLLCILDTLICSLDTLHVFGSDNTQRVDSQRDREQDEAGASETHLLAL